MIAKSYGKLNDPGRSDATNISTCLDRYGETSQPVTNSLDLNHHLLRSEADYNPSTPTTSIDDNIPLS